VAAMNAKGSCCERCEGPVDPDDLWCPVCRLAQPHPTPVSGEQSHRMTLVRCDACGAAVTYSAEHRTARCAFCGCDPHLEETSDPVQQAEQFVPFGVSQDQAQDALRAWLSTRGFFRPKDLHSAAILESLQPLWWPAWIIDAQCHVCWTADTDQGARRSAWAPIAGSGPMKIERLVLSASKGLRLSECASLIPSFDLSAAETPERAPPNPVVETFESQRSVARQRIVQTLESEARAKVESALPGSRKRNVNVSVLLRNLTTRRVALPTYVLAYRYGRRLHRVLIHGQDPSLVLGNSPISPWKVMAVVIAGVVVAGVAAFWAYESLVRQAL
jgi:hypothetical protein